MNLLTLPASLALTAFVAGFVAICLVAMGICAGCVLLIKGLRGRRVGDEPRCGSCEYNLTGIAAVRCPECGTSLTEKTRTHGKRQRRLDFIAIGSLILALSMGIGGLWTLRVLGSFDWYARYPTAWVLRDFQADQGKACDELARRLGSGGLSDSEADRLMNALLAKHRQKPPSRLLPLVSDRLARLAAEGKLAKRHRYRYLAQLFSLAVNQRPIVRIGDRMVVELTVEANAGFALSEGHWLFGAIDVVSIGSQAIDHHGYEQILSAALTGVPGVDTAQVSLSVPEHVPLGKQILIASCRLALHRKISGGGYVREPEWSQAVTLSSSIEILPRHAPAPVRWIEDPELEERLAEAFRGVFVAEELDEDRVSIGPAPGRLGNALPVAVAFDVILRVGDDEIPAGQWAFGTDGRPRVNHAPPVSRIAAETGDLILRNSREVALQTNDLYEIWRGELNLGRVEFEEPRGD